VNAATASAVGKSIDEVLGRDDVQLFDAESGRELMMVDRSIMAAGESVIREETVTVAGVTRTYLSTKSPYRDANGAVIGLAGISCDITDRKWMEDQLKSSERRWRELADAIPQIVWIASADGEADSSEFQGRHIFRNRR